MSASTHSGLSRPGVVSRHSSPTCTVRGGAPSAVDERPGVRSSDARGVAHWPAFARSGLTASVRLVPACAPEPGSERFPDALASDATGVGQGSARRRSPVRGSPFEPYVAAVGVGHSPVSDTQDEVPDPAVGCPDIRGGDSGDLHLVAKPMKSGRHHVQVPPSESTDVLDEDARRRELFDEPLELEPEAGPLAAVDASSHAGEGHVLAGEPSDEHVDG